jgi:hypothetical protein
MQRYEQEMASYSATGSFSSVPPPLGDAGADLPDDAALAAHADAASAQQVTAPLLANLLSDTRKSSSSPQPRCGSGGRCFGARLTAQRSEHDDEGLSDGGLDEEDYESGEA